MQQQTETEFNGNIEPKYFNIHDLSKFLGVKERTIRAYVYHREIPYLKLNKLLRFDVKEINKWLQKKTTSYPVMEGAE